jgi:hypothetical protein
VGTNAVIGSKTFVATTNATVRFEIEEGGVSKIAVQNQATLAASWRCLSAQAVQGS